jgi:hypothetical protein
MANECCIRYTPVTGTGRDDPSCGVLEFGGVTLLMDCGWTEACSVDQLDHIQACVGVPGPACSLRSEHDMVYCGPPWAVCVVVRLDCCIHTAV